MKTEILEKAAKLFYRTIIAKVIEPGVASFSDDQLTQGQITCIRFVKLHSEPSIGGIAAGLAVSDAAAAKLVDRLVKKELLIREEDKRDRRVLKIKLTATAEILLDKVNRIENDNFQSIIAKMPPEAVEQLEQGIAEFLKAALVSAEDVDRVCLKCGWEHLPQCYGSLRYRELTGREKKNW